MNEQTKENWDNWEKVISVALGVIGVLAILFKYFKSGFDWNELLDATVNLSQVAIPVLVVIVTHRALMKKKPDVYKMLEDAIQEWATQNSYLIDDKIVEEGKHKRRRFSMLTKKITKTLSHGRSLPAIFQVEVNRPPKGHFSILTS